MADERTPLLQIRGVRTPSEGLGVPMAVVFVIGTICGLLTIPRAVVNAGWAGVAVLISCGCISAYTGVLLGRCWTLLQGRYPEYRELRVTDPYPTIALRAAGKPGEYITRFCIDVTLFGGATVFLILGSDDITHMVMATGHAFYPCYMLLIVWCFLTPLCWFGTPKDFWGAAVLVAFATSVGAILITIAIVQDAQHHEDAKELKVTTASFFKGFATIMYSFNGNSIFPTIQVDMEDPGRFPLAVTIGMAIVLCLYLPVVISGLVVLKDDMESNVLHVLPKGIMYYAIGVLITAHMLMAFVVVSNPVTQQIEGFLNVPDKFTWKRVVVRTIYTSTVLFVALSIPQFSAILLLVGGSTIACTTFIFPPLFYYLLSRQKIPEEGHGPPLTNANGDPNGGSGNENPLSWPQLRISPMVKVFLFLITAVGVVEIPFSLYFSISSFFSGNSTEFISPCYVNMTAGLETHEMSPIYLFFH